MKTLDESKRKIKSKVNKNKIKDNTNIGEEINGFSYNLSKLYDKRNYCNYYVSLLKT